MPSAVPTFGLWYTDALERHGRDLGTGRIYASQWAIVAEDRERVWAEVPLVFHGSRFRRLWST
jgi:hypothetical protein